MKKKFTGTIFARFHLGNHRRAMDCGCPDHKRPNFHDPMNRHRESEMEMSRASLFHPHNARMVNEELLIYGLIQQSLFQP